MSLLSDWMRLLSLALMARSSMNFNRNSFRERLICVRYYPLGINRSTSHCGDWILQGYLWVELWILAYSVGVHARTLRREDAFAGLELDVVFWACTLWKNFKAGNGSRSKAAQTGKASEQ
jgi:hypothetical protein